jgi:hypothetical protein
MELDHGGLIPRFQYDSRRISKYVDNAACSQFTGRRKQTSAKQLEGNMLEHTCRGDDAMTPPSMRT